MVRPLFKHMLPAEVQLWERFLRLHGGKWTRYEYDLHVGEGIPLKPEWPGNIKAMAYEVTAKRIDAVGFMPGEITIFEVKPDAGLAAIGQLVSYRELYLRQFTPPERIRLAVVTDNILPDEVYVYEKQGIEIYLV